MMVISFGFNILSDKIRKTLNTECIRFSCFFAPITGSFFTHNAYCGQCFNYLVLNKVKFISFFFPFITRDLAEFCLKDVIFAVIGKSAFKIGNMRICTAKTELFIKHFQKNRKDRFLILFSGTFTF